MTSNLAAISVASVLLYQKTAFIWENHIQLKNMERIFCGYETHTVVKEAEVYYYHHKGMEFLIKKLYAGIPQENEVRNASISFLNKHLYYLPQNRVKNTEVFEYELQEVLQNLLQTTEQSADVLYIDTVSHQLTSKVILEQSDLIVVNLNQDIQIIQHFFENYESLLGKSVFLIGNYQPESRYHLYNLQRKYHIATEDIATIPYHIPFRDAIVSGTVIPFLSRNFYCAKGDIHFYFMQQLKQAVHMIGRKLEHLYEATETV